jgi:hypothetical protein
MFRDQVAKKLSQGFPTLLFGKYSRDVARHGIRATGSYFFLDSAELLLGKRDGDLGSCHTGIIPEL